METRLLKVFQAVTETGSLVGAASRLRLTPSAISHSLKSLEAELGCRLFERVGKRLVLNQAGDQLIAAIRQPLTALEAAAEDIRRLGRWGQSRLRIAAPPSACEHIIPRIVQDLKRTQPSLELQIQSGNSTQVVELVRDNKIDAGLCLSPETSLGLDVRPAFEDELLLACSSQHPWIQNAALTADMFNSEPFISHHRDSATARLFLDYCHREGLVPNFLMEVEHLGAIIELLKLNMGISVVAPWMVEDEVRQGLIHLRPMGQKPLKRQWSVVSLAVRAKSYTEELFCRLCCSCPGRLNNPDVRTPELLPSA